MENVLQAPPAAATAAVAAPLRLTPEEALYVLHAHCGSHILSYLLKGPSFMQSTLLYNMEDFYNGAPSHAEQLGVDGPALLAKLSAASGEEAAQLYRAMELESHLSTLSGDMAANLRAAGFPLE